MAKSLRTLIPRTYSRKVLDHALNTYLKGDPNTLRAEVIVWAAMIDVGLEKLLRSRMRKLSADDEDAIFGGTGSLSGFAAKTRAAYALGIIGPSTKHDLLTINDIRNLFAHAPRSITMSNQHLWRKVQTLSFVQWLAKNKGFTYEDFEKRANSRQRGGGLLEAMAGLALMLCVTRHPKKLLPPARGAPPLRWGGNTLRF